MYRRKLFEKNEGYHVSPETLRCEDYEIFMRLHQLGYQGYNIQQYLFAYREDKQSFQKRRFHFRINEAKLRYRNFKAMHLLFSLGWLYVIRPVVGGLIPPGIVALLKRGETWWKCKKNSYPKMPDWSIAVMNPTDRREQRLQSYKKARSEKEIYERVLAPTLYEFVLWVLQEALPSGKNGFTFWQGTVIRCILPHSGSVNNMIWTSSADISKCRDMRCVCRNIIFSGNAVWNASVSEESM